MNGTVDGQLGDHILIATPFIITGDQIDKFMDAARYAGAA